MFTTVFVLSTFLFGNVSRAADVHFPTKADCEFVAVKMREAKFDRVCLPHVIGTSK